MDTIDIKHPVMQKMLGDYWHWVWYTKRLHWPYLVERTVEIDAPYRIGKARVFSIPGFKRALILGRWTEETNEDEDKAILDALQGYPDSDWDRTLGRPDPEEIDWLPEGWTYEEARAYEEAQQ